MACESAWGLRLTLAELIWVKRLAEHFAEVGGFCKSQRQCHP